jgi:copper transport protein
MLQMSLSSFLRRVGMCLGLAIGLSLFFSDQMALAHNAIDTSSPADGDVIAAPLNEWVISFTNDVPLNSASAEIINADGVRTPLTNLAHGDSKKIVRFSLPKNLAGVISGRWRLVSTDGHVVSGRVQFTINDDVNSNLVATTIPDQDFAITNEPPNDFTSANSIVQEPIRWSLRVVGYGALFLLGGLLFAQFNLAQGIFGNPTSLLAVRSSAIALTVIPAIQALLFVSDLNDSSVFRALFQINDALSSTPGSMFLLRALSGAVFIYLIAQRTVHNFSHTFTKLASLNAVMYLATLSYTGHARSFGAPWLGIPVDMAHTAASAIWLGGLIVIIFFIAPRFETKELLNAFVRFGQFAKIAVITIIATGVIQTLRLHGGITTLFTSSHGRLLLLKIVVVSAMLKVGDINRLRIVALSQRESVAVERKKDLLVRASYTEAAIGAVVIAITAILVTSSFN